MKSPFPSFTSDSQTVAHDSKINLHLFCGGSLSDMSVFFRLGQMVRLNVLCAVLKHENNPDIVSPNPTAFFCQNVC